MALINCPECGKEISDKAASCPNCGTPINETENKQSIFGIVGFILSIIGLFCGINVFFYI